jgi:hypothetical protein
MRKTEQEGILSLNQPVPGDAREVWWEPPDNEQPCKQHDVGACGCNVPNRFQVEYPSESVVFIDRSGVSASARTRTWKAFVLLKPSGFPYAGPSQGHHDDHYDTKIGIPLKGCPCVDSDSMYVTF